MNGNVRREQAPAPVDGTIYSAEAVQVSILSLMQAPISHLGIFAPTHVWTYETDSYLLYVGRRCIYGTDESAGRTSAASRQGC